MDWASAKYCGLSVEDISPELAAAMLAMGPLPPAFARDLGTAWLQRNLDTQAIRELAGLTSAEEYEAQETFSRALHELGVVGPSESDAIAVVARAIAVRITQGRLSQSAGAEILARLSTEYGHPDILTDFYALHVERQEVDGQYFGVASQSKKREQLLGALDEKVVTAADKLVGSAETADKQTKTAGELMASLEADPEWRARRDAREAEFQVAREGYQQAERLLVSEIRAAGYDIDSVWDLVNNAPHPVLERRFVGPYPLAVPILIRHLDLPHPAKVREGVIRALTIRWPERDLEEALLASFREESDQYLRWVLANALRTAMPYHRRRELPEIKRALEAGMFPK